MTYDVEHLFMCLVVICVSSLVKSLFKCLAHVFKNWAAWAACKFWRLILCQLLRVQVFSPILIVVFFSCLWFLYLFLVCFLPLIFVFFVVVSLVFSVCFHFGVCLFVWLLSFLFSLFVCVCYFLCFCLFGFAFTIHLEVLFVCMFPFFFPLFFCTMWLAGSWCSGLGLDLSLWGGRANSRTFDLQRSSSLREC